MIYGFTGTQQNMTLAQYGVVRDVLTNGALHHGDCIGSDALAHQIGRLNGLWIVGHPPDNDTKRAFCDFDEVRNPLPYIKRDHEIVDESELLIATPGQFIEQLRSGTWATIRYARKIDRPRLIVYPDGTTDDR